MRNHWVPVACPTHPAIGDSPGVPIGQTGRVRDSVAVVHDLVAKVTPLDLLESEHIADTLRWLESTDDVFRRSKPAVPERHLVSYVVILDRDNFDVLLVDHVNAGLFLPPGGHVEPDEHPAAAARRECREELGIEASFSQSSTPAFVTVTTTVGLDAGHTDVSLWFISDGSRSLEMTLDQFEFCGSRWWTLEEVTSASGNEFDPPFHRFMTTVL
jgi:8-oxo-dGTP diphosphatase